MHRLLHIGEVAQLLGVTTKTIRHYHKVGLLQEPERTESGYRLYNAQDLLRLKQIRHMQAFGLPLKQIKTILGDAAHEQTLREILQALDTELAGQIQILEERRARIHALLAEDSPITIDQPTTVASFEMVKELVGERLSTVSPATLEMEKQLWMLIDEFDWPANHREHMLQIARDLAAHPEWLERLSAFQEKVTALSLLPEDAPEVQRLFAEYREDKQLQAVFAEMETLLAHMPSLEGPFAQIFRDVLVTQVSPAQRRFLAEIERWRSTQETASTE